MEDTYRTIRDLSEGYYTEKRSRFLSFALPVHTPGAPVDATWSTHPQIAPAVAQLEAWIAATK